MSGKTSCWSCNYCYDFDAKKCPACGMSNANVNIDAAESEQKLSERIAALEASERRLRDVLTALCKKLPTNDITLSNYHARDELIAARECIATAGIEVK